MKRKDIRIEELEEENRHLSNELWHTRHTIFRTLPEDMSYILTSYTRCKNRKAANRWQYEVAAKIIDLTPKERIIGNFEGKPQVECPLCGRTTQSFCWDGFIFPEGLRRHLLGQGTANLCDIMKIALDLAHNNWEPRLTIQDAIEDANRRASETLFLVKPDEDPKLIDEFSGYVTPEPPRTPEGIEWAEARLKFLGFKRRINGNLKSYVKKIGDFWVYADPRFNKRIEFEIYNISGKTPQKKNSNHSQVKRISGFSFYDSWMHDLLAKFNDLVQHAINDF